MFKAKLFLSLAVIAGIQHFSAPDEMDTASIEQAGRASCGLYVPPTGSQAAMVQIDNAPQRGCTGATPAAAPAPASRTAV
jgi:hypothetical protein